VCGVWIRHGVWACNESLTAIINPNCKVEGVVVFA